MGPHEKVVLRHTSHAEQTPVCKSLGVLRFCATALCSSLCTGATSNHMELVIGC